MRALDIDEVAEAIGRKASDVNGLLYPFKLLLASEPPGRLNQRKFCTADAYALAIAFALVDLSGRREESCRALEHYLWWQPIDREDMEREARGEKPLTADERITMRKRLAMHYHDPANLPRSLRHRDLYRPILLAARYGDWRARLYHCFTTDDLRVAATSADRLWVVNLTALLARVDSRLAELEAERAA